MRNTALGLPHCPQALLPFQYSANQGTRHAVHGVKTGCISAQQVELNGAHGSNNLWACARLCACMGMHPWVWGGKGYKRKSATWKDNHPSHIARKEKGTGPTLSALRPSAGCTSELPNRGPRAPLCRHTRTSPPPPLVSWHTAGFPGLTFCLAAERRFRVHTASPSDTAASPLHSSTSQFPSLLPIS